MVVGFFGLGEEPDLQRSHNSIARKVCSGIHPVGDRTQSVLRMEMRRRILVSGAPPQPGDKTYLHIKPEVCLLHAHLVSLSGLTAAGARG